MKFIAIMWTGTDTTGGTAADWQAWQTFESEAREAGVYVDGGEFEGADHARLVTTQLSGAQLPDAAESRTFAPGDMQPGGYYVFECSDIEEAVTWANRLPTYGRVEVRGIASYDY